MLKIMVDATEPASIRLRAVDSVFHHSAKAIELEDRERSEANRRGDRNEHGADQPKEFVLTVLPQALPPDPPTRIIDVRSQR